MPYRYQTLERIIHGYELTGVPLVGSDGRILSPEPYAGESVRQRARSIGRALVGRSGA